MIFRKTLIASLAALAVGGATAAAQADYRLQGNANAQGSRAPYQPYQGPVGNGGHFGNGGGHGFQGGGNHAFQGGGNHGWQGDRHDGGGHRGSWGPAVGFGLLGAGLAAGAIGSENYNDGYSDGYGDDDCYRYRPTYDSYGNYVGRRLVNICQ